MVKANFTGNWLDYWTLILIGELLICKVVGYGTVEVKVESFKHNDQIQGICFEGVEQVDEGQSPKMGDGKVSGIIYWNVDDHIMYPAAPPIPPRPVSPDMAKMLSEVRAMIGAYT